MEAIREICDQNLLNIRTDVVNGSIVTTQDMVTVIDNCREKMAHDLRHVQPPPPVLKPDDVIVDRNFLASLATMVQKLSAEMKHMQVTHAEDTKMILAAIGNITTSGTPELTAESVSATSTAADSTATESASANSTTPSNSTPANSVPANLSTPANSVPADSSTPANSNPVDSSIPSNSSISVNSALTTSAPAVTSGHAESSSSRRVKRPLRREGAFRGLPDETAYEWMKLVSGRGSQAVEKSVPPVPRWPDQSSPCPPSRRRSCGPSDFIARQRQLAKSAGTDKYGRVIPPAYATQLEPPGSSSSPSSFHDSQESSSSNEENGGALTPSSSTPPSSPSIGRGKKRARASEDAEGHRGQPATGTGDEESAPSVGTDPQTPPSTKGEDGDLAQGPAKRRKIRPSIPERSISTRSLSRTYTMADVTDDCGGL